MACDAMTQIGQAMCNSIGSGTGPRNGMRAQGRGMGPRDGTGRRRRSVSATVAGPNGSITKGRVV